MSYSYILEDNMKEKRISTGYLLLLTTAVISCANPVSPTGGNKDQSPPKIENYEINTNNNQKKIIIQFDENIVYQNTIELSPYLIKTKPTVTTTRNSISIILDSNTNSINFNDAIKDLNEGNKAILSNLIIGNDSSAKYYKIQSLPKNKDKIYGYSQYNGYIYPYNTSINGYASGEGLPNNKKIHTTLFLDKNKNQKYDSIEWYYTDTIITHTKNKNTFNDTLDDSDSLNSLKNKISDTIEVYLYPPIINEIKYYHDSNNKRTLLIISNSDNRNLLKKKYLPHEIHNDTLVYNNLITINEIGKTLKNVQFKNSRTSINKSNKILYYQYIYENDTIYFQEKCINDFNAKNTKKSAGITDTTSYIKTEIKIPTLDMNNPFTNPNGTNFQNIPYLQNIINQIQEDLNIEFISHKQLQKQLQKEFNILASDSNKILKPREIKKLSRVSFQNDSNFTSGLSIYKEGKEIITASCPQGTKNIILPIGNYEYFTWKDSNNDQICNQTEEILEYFFEMEVLEKIENTIIVKKNKIQEKKVKIPSIIQSE